MDIEKMDELFLLKYKCGDELIERYMNEENGEMVDEKIEVCKRIMNGDAPADIENYYEVLDDYPKDNGDGESFW